MTTTTHTWRGRPGLQPRAASNGLQETSRTLLQLLTADRKFVWILWLFLKSWHHRRVPKNTQPFQYLAVKFNCKLNLGKYIPNHHSSENTMEPARLAVVLCPTRKHTDNGGCHRAADTVNFRSFPHSQQQLPTNFSKTHCIQHLSWNLKEWDNATVADGSGSWPQENLLYFSAKNLEEQEIHSTSMVDDWWFLILFFWVFCFVFFFYFVCSGMMSTQHRMEWCYPNHFLQKYLPKETRAKTIRIFIVLWFSEFLNCSNCVTG